MSTVDFTRSTIPDRSLVQRREALAEANRIRVARKELKADIRAGRVDWREAFENPDMATMEVFDLLCAVPRIGPRKISVIFRRLGISHSKTVAGLSSRQRRELVGRMEQGPPFDTAAGL